MTLLPECRLRFVLFLQVQVGSLILGLRCPTGRETDLSSIREFF